MVATDCTPSVCHTHLTNERVYNYNSIVVVCVDTLYKLFTSDFLNYKIVYLHSSPYCDSGELRFL